MNGHNWWWKEDDNCKERNLNAIKSSNSFCAIMSTTFQRGFDFHDVENRQKKLEHKSDKKISKRNWATEQTDVVVFISEALFRSCFLVVALPADGVQRWGSASEQLEFRLRSRTHQQRVTLHWFIMRTKITLVSDLGCLRFGVHTAYWHWIEGKHCHGGKDKSSQTANCQWK